MLLLNAMARRPCIEACAGDAAASAPYAEQTIAACSSSSAILQTPCNQRVPQGQCNSHVRSFMRTVETALCFSDSGAFFPILLSTSS